MKMEPKQTPNRDWLKIILVVIVLGALIFGGYRISGASINLGIVSLNLAKPTSAPSVIALSCPYNGDSDQATFRNLLVAEHTAALTENLDIINEIFLPDTMMPDYSTGTPIPVLENYRKKFAGVDFVTLNLDEIGIVRNDGTTAYVTKTGSGILVVPETGERVPFDMKASDGKFVFKRNADGCWKIAGFEQTSTH